MCGQGLCLERDAGVCALPTKMQKLSPPLPESQPNRCPPPLGSPWGEAQAPPGGHRTQHTPQAGDRSPEDGRGGGCVSVQVEILHLP